MTVREMVWRRIDEMADDLWKLSMRIHDHPELGFEEHQAAGWLTETLGEAGFSVERGVGNMATAFRATHPAIEKGPRLAVLAEYDALPDLGHACGHNIIATIAVGAALGLAPHKAELPGELGVLGTPAEEGGGGKILLIQAGLFKDVDAALMVHPSDRTLVNRGSLAISRVDISFEGRAAHASARPEDGINALDAVIQTFNGLNALRQHIKDGARIHGIISDGGRKPNIVPEYAAAQFYVRAEQNAYRDDLIAKLQNCAEGAALATGARLTFRRVGTDYKAICSNRAMSEVYARHIEAAGSPIEKTEGGMGSTDMGDVSWEVPAIHPYIRITDRRIPTHSREFAEASRSEVGKRGMIAAAKAVAATCIDFWTDPQLFQRVQDEFRVSRRAAGLEQA